MQEEHKWKYFSLPLPSNYKRHYQNPQTWLSHTSCCKLKNATAYRLSKVLQTKLTKLSFFHQKKTPIQITQSLKEIPSSANTKFASPDISNIHSNISVSETKWRHSDWHSFLCSTIVNFLQYTEFLHITTLPIKCHIIGFFHYIDDILISSQTNLSPKLTDFNSIYPKLYYTAETENNNINNYLDTSIQFSTWSFSTYRKPMFTNTIIPSTSRHPAQHK